MALVEAMVRRHRGGSRIGAWITCVVAVAIAWAALAGCRGVVAESLPASPTASSPESPPQSPPESPPAGGGGADLLITEIMVSDRNPAAGGSIVLSVIVGNDGTAAAPATRVRFLRSADEEITTADSEVGTVELAPIVVAGRASGSVEVSVPATGGTSYYGACVEAVTGESDTGNNCSAAVAVVVVAASGEPGRQPGREPLDQPSLEPGIARPGAVRRGPDGRGAHGKRRESCRGRVVHAVGDGAQPRRQLVLGIPRRLRFFRSTDATITVADTEEYGCHTGGRVWPLRAASPSQKGVSAPASRRHVLLQRLRGRRARRDRHRQQLFACGDGHGAGAAAGQTRICASVLPK